MSESQKHRQQLLVENIVEVPSPRPFVDDVASSVAAPAPVARALVLKEEDEVNGTEAAAVSLTRDVDDSNSLHTTDVTDALAPLRKLTNKATLSTTPTKPAEVTVTTVTATVTKNIDSNHTANHRPKSATPTTTVASTGKKRLCRFPGCQRVIKSQGHCQRHGARAKRCRYPNCTKQAQGTHDGLCKRHWRILHNTTTATNDTDNKTSGEESASLLTNSTSLKPTGTSVYEYIIPNSIIFRPSPNQMVIQMTTAPMTAAGSVASNKNHIAVELDSNDVDTNDNIDIDENIEHQLGNNDVNHNLYIGKVSNVKNNSAVIRLSELVIDPIMPPQYSNNSNNNNGAEHPHLSSSHNNLMPLVQFINDNSHLPFGWHRIYERRTRSGLGTNPLQSLTTQFEPWERQLAFIEICLLSGGTIQEVNWKNFCHAWGRERTFITNLTSNICEKRGSMDRKRNSSGENGKRSDNNIQNRKRASNNNSTCMLYQRPLKKTNIIISQTSRIIPHTTVQPAATTISPIDYSNLTNTSIASPLVLRTSVKNTSAQRQSSLAASVGNTNNIDQSNHPILDDGIINMDESSLALLVDDDHMEKEQLPYEIMQV